MAPGLALALLPSVRTGDCGRALLAAAYWTEACILRSARPAARRTGASTKRSRRRSHQRVTRPTQFPLLAYGGAGVFGSSNKRRPASLTTYNVYSVVILTSRIARLISGRKV